MIKKEKPKKSRLATVVELTGALAAIGVLVYQMMFSEEEINGSIFLHGGLIFLVSLAALTAIVIAYFAIKNKKKRKG